MIEENIYTMDLSRTTKAKNPISTTTNSFTDNDLMGITTPYHDPLVITLIVRMKDQVKIRLNRVLIDTSASMDVLYWDAFDQLGFCKADLGPCWYRL